MRTRRVSWILAPLGLLALVHPAPAMSATAPVSAKPLRCVFAGSLTFKPAITETPRDTTVGLKGHMVLCTDPEGRAADVTGTFKGQAGTQSARLTGTLTYTWHLKSGGTEPSTQQVTGFGVKGAFSFEGTTTAGRHQGRPVRLVPVVPYDFVPGENTDLRLLSRLTIKP